MGRVRITVGATGSDRTEVRSGLNAGDQVVLATLGTPLPSSDSTTNRRLTGGVGTPGTGTLGGGTFGGGTGRAADRESRKAAMAVVYPRGQR